jgi:hypothetical protein
VGVCVWQFYKRAVKAHYARSLKILFGVPTRTARWLLATVSSSRNCDVSEVPDTWTHGRRETVLQFVRGFALARQKYFLSIRGSSQSSREMTMFGCLYLVAEQSRFNRRIQVCVVVGACA